MVDETFATRDLVFAMNRTPRYWVLAMSENSTNLFAGVLDNLEAVGTNESSLTNAESGDRLSFQPQLDQQLIANLYGGLTRLNF